MGVTVGVAVGSGVYGAGVTVGGSRVAACSTIGSVGTGVGVGLRVMTCPQPGKSSPPMTRASTPIHRCLSSSVKGFSWLMVASITQGKWMHEWGICGLGLSLCSLL